MSNRKQAKPIGKTGHTRITRANESPEFVTVPFPTAKEEVESYVARPFVQAASDDGLFPFDVLEPPHQNPTDDFDFTLRTSSGDRYLELLEVHLRNIVESKGQSGQASYDVHAVARYVLGQILEKSRRYGSTQGIVLLTYVTHWQFALHDSVLHLLAYWLLLRPPPVFQQVFYMSFLDAGSVEETLLYPRPDSAPPGFAPEQYQGSRVLWLNPDAWQLTKE